VRSSFPWGKRRIKPYSQLCADSQAYSAVSSKRAERLATLMSRARPV